MRIVGYILGIIIILLVVFIFVNSLVNVIKQVKVLRERKKNADKAKKAFEDNSNKEV